LIKNFSCILILTLAGFAVAQSNPKVCAQKPAASSPSRLYIDGTQLCWNGKPLKMAGYGTLDLATRDGYDYAKFLNTIRLVDDASINKRHGVNLTRIWAPGTSNVPDCYHTHKDHDPNQPPMTMPFQLLAGEACTKDHVFPKYNMCISNLSCEKGVGLSNKYRTQLQKILTEARKNGIIVELVLFDSYFMGRHKDAQPLYAKTPWNPLNNNMQQNIYRPSPNSTEFAACLKLPQSTNQSDIKNDAFPAFYEICSDISNTEKCDKTLNCLGLIQKDYVKAMVDLVRTNRNGSDHVFFEVMNRSRFDKRDSRKEGFDLEKFKRWHDVVGYWIKCMSDNNCKSTKGDYLVLAEVGIPNFNDLACSKCLPDPLDALAMPNIDFINLQAHTWKNSPAAQGPCKTAMIAVNRFKKPVIIDTDSAYDRNDKCRIEEWAGEISSCGNPGQVHFNHLDGMTFGYPSPKGCGFKGKGDAQTQIDLDEKYLDCHALDTIGAANATYLSDIITTSPPESCPHSIGPAGTSKWCSSTCKQ
jgi:hypothetical protein